MFYNKHMKVWHFSIIIMRKTSFSTIYMSKNKITIRCLVKVDMPLKEKDGIHQTDFCGTHHVRYHDLIGS